MASPPPVASLLLACIVEALPCGFVRDRNGRKNNCSPSYSLRGHSQICKDLRADVVHSNWVHSQFGIHYSSCLTRPEQLSFCAQPRLYIASYLHLHWLYSIIKLSHVTIL